MEKSKFNQIQKEANELLNKHYQFQLEFSLKKLSIQNQKFDSKIKETERAIFLQQTSRELAQQSSKEILEKESEIFKQKQKWRREQKEKWEKERIMKSGKRYFDIFEEEAKASFQNHLHPKEFYGLDLSNVKEEVQTENYERTRRQKELYEIEKRAFESEKNLEQWKKGNEKLIIEALLKTQNVSLEELSKEIAKQPKSIGRVEKPMVTFSMDALSPRGTKEADSTVKEELKESVKSKKNWQDQIQKNQVDYSEFFPDEIAENEGILTFRIEKLKPKLQNPNLFGQFCQGDCYIILYSRKKEDFSISHRIYQWLGDKASTDKKACSAIFAVGLKNMLLQAEIYREQAREESESFIQFIHGQGKDLIYLDPSKASESGLYKVEEREFPILMYKLSFQKRLASTDNLGSSDSKQQKKISHMILVEKSPDQLNENHVFLIDAGFLIYQWNGSHSSFTDQSKCRLIAQRICKSERPGKADFFEIQQGKEPEEFWDVFDGQKPEPVNLSKASLSILEGESAQITIYNIKDDMEEISSLDQLSKLKTFPIEKMSLPSASLLISNECCIVDCQQELYLWIGKKSKPQTREYAEKITQKFVFPLIPNRPSFMVIAKVYEGAESEIFKQRFTNWESHFSSLSKSQEKLKKEKQEKESKLMKSDLFALMTPPPSGQNTKEEEIFYEELFEKAKELLLDLQVFLFDWNKKKFIKQKDGNTEKGHFYSGDTLVFLCLYKTKSHSKEEEEEHSEPGEAVVFVWEGRHAHVVPKLQFQHIFKHQLETAMKSSFGNLPIKFIFIQQEKESLALLAALDKKFVIHLGNDPNSMKAEDILDQLPARMYHLRTDQKYHVTRAIELTPTFLSLQPRDIFLLVKKNMEILVWVGKGVSKSEEALVPPFIESRFPNYSHQIFKQNHEPADFCTLLSPYEPVTQLLPARGQIAYYSRPPPRLFQMHCRMGYFKVDALDQQFSPLDLQSDLMVLLDSGPGRGKGSKCWIWVGSGVSDVLKKWVQKATELYLEKINDGRQMTYLFYQPNQLPQTTNNNNNEEEGEEEEKHVRKKSERLKLAESDVCVEYEGKESQAFKSFFHGWGSEWTPPQHFTKDDVLKVKRMFGEVKDGEILNAFKLEQMKEKEKKRQNQNQK